MKLDYLTTLRAVIRTGSFAAAASQSNLTPSAVSQRMQQLESYFGRPLFDRSTREARATPLAHAVAATVVDALDGLEALRDRRTVEVSGQVRLGAIYSAQLSIVPACLLRLRQRHPTLEVSLLTGSSEDLVAATRAARIDAAIVVRASRDSRGIRWLDLQKESFVLLVPATTHESTLKRVAQSLPWIRYNHSSTSGQTAARHVRSQVPGLKPTLDVQTASVIVGMVAAGLGFSVMPQVPQALLRVYGVHQIRLDRAIPQRQIGLALRSADQDNRRVQALADSIHEAHEELRKSGDGLG